MTEELKDPVIDSKGRLQLKLGACLTDPTKRLVHDLHDIGHLCNVVRNGMIRHWERWREDHPDWKPEQRTIRGEPKVDKNDKPVMENLAISQSCEQEMYHVGRKLAPHLSPTIISSLRSEVVDKLKSKLPPKHKGNARFHWDGILSYEIARDCFREIRIPVPNATTILCYEGQASRNLSKKITAQTLQCGQSSAVICFRMFSESAGRKSQSPIVRLDVSRLSEGNRNLLKNIAKREWRLSDSFLKFEDGQWYLLITYNQPREPLGLDPERVATLWTLPGDAGQPFLIELNDKIRWYIGDGRSLVYAYKRLETRRLTLQNRYRYSSSARRGHGTKHFFSIFRPYERSTKQSQTVFTWRMIADLIKFCKKYNIGKIVYREPGLQFRQSSWFATHDTPYDWTQLQARLSHKTKIYGIKLEVMRVSAKEHAEKFPKAEEVSQ